MPHLTFEVDPVAVRKEYTKRYDFADHYLSHGIEITAAFGKIRDLGRVSFLPDRIKMNT
jgi:hypothetical protein